MPKNLKQYGQARATNIMGQQPAGMDGFVNIGPALVRSPVTRLFGRPYPIQFRAQGALDAWAHALGNTGLWPLWQAPGTLCWQIRQEILRQLECTRSSSSLVARISDEDCLRLAFQVSTNLKYHLSEGTVVEATAALETLLANSDVDLSLPMSMVAPPYRAQYLRFGEVAKRYLKVPDPQSPDHCFDGVFCFLTQHPSSGDREEKCWTLELVFISKRQDSYGGHVSLLGETDRGDLTVGEWLAEILGNVKAADESEIHRSMHAAVSYVVRVFLYMALKQARVTPHCEYDEALRRAAGLRERKRAKLLQRAASLYNGILVGPETLPPGASEGAAGGGVAPHWRRGHFRMQPFGIGNQQRKLIFVAPVLVHAEQLQGDVPAPKSYRAGAAVVSTA
ncbi:hypothetical protein ASD28_17345 [Massilia sp. Root133]|uniref:hypothetical protein n=1 Tax=unclassified Massilia TaxID=2609279 RepID=UPI0006FA2890|nr:MULTISPECIES: hypothetical protein [unclassified Massilia]KQX96856.1 hypothetical protein ASD28_17345 [Massilia sp. Root133]KQZ52564.1 hypothetical protein ASD92_18775 [Massilia sp. Root1485]